MDVYDSGTAELPSLEIKGLETTFLSGQSGSQIAQTPKKSYYRTKLRPDVSLLSAPQFLALCKHIRLTNGESRTAALIDEAFYYMAEFAIKQIPELSISTLSSKGRKLYRSLQRISDSVTSGRLDYGTDGWEASSDVERQAVLDIVRRSGDEGNFAVIVGNNLPGIIQGTVDPLALTTENDVLGRYYRNPRINCQW